MSARLPWTAGIDFGGTNIKLGLVDPSGRVANVRVLSSTSVQGPSGFVDEVSAAVERLAETVRVRPTELRGVGVGAPGPVDVERGIVDSLVNVQGWRRVRLGRLLEQRLRCPCFVDNDVNLFALGEWTLGAGRGARHVVCLTLGTGVGGGLIINGQLYRGSRGAAGELGHMVIKPHGRQCGCGVRGCLEAHVGTAAILSLGRQALRRTTGPMRLLLKEADRRLTPRLINQAARQGDTAARGVWEEIGRLLGSGLANITNLLNPERIIIGGGVASAWRFFYPELIRTLRAQAMDISGRSVRVVRATLGNNAGIVGAAVLVWEMTGGRRLPQTGRRSPIEGRSRSLATA